VINLHNFLSESAKFYEKYDKNLSSYFFWDTVHVFVFEIALMRKTRRFHTKGNEYRMMLSLQRARQVQGDSCCQ